MTALLRIFALVALALVLAAGAQAHDSRAAPADPVAKARQVITDRGPALGIDAAGLQTLTVRQGRGAHYVRFQQTVDGVPVEGAQVVVALPAGAGQPPLIAGSHAPAIRAPVPRNVTAAEALKRALKAASVDPRSLRGQPNIEEMYLNAGKEGVLGWRITLPAPAGTWLVGVRADTGSIVYITDLRRFDSGRVFNPNPPKGSGGSIPPPSDCDSAANEALLAGQYQTLALLGRTPAQNKLKGEYVDLTATGIVGGYKSPGLASEASGNFIYGCNDDRFEEVMVYYHLDATQRKIQSLGFSGEASIVGRPIPAHAHYFNDCNAFYDPVDRGLHFGDGDACSFKADAAEDADVIVHEYGHAIQDDQVPAWGFGSAAAAEEAWAMGEGFSDFLTGAMFGDSCIGEWFSFGGSCLRNISNTAHYPEDYDACRPAPPQPAEPHCAGLIWGGALWDLVQSLGGDQTARNLALSLVLESQFLLDPQATFAEAAAAIRQADGLLYGGAHQATIDAVFAARGISSLGGVSDFPYVYLRIRHPFRGDLDVDLLVGSTSSPVCTLSIWSPSPSDSADDLVGYVNITPANCSSFIPPSVAQRWYLRVRDVFSQDVGTLEEFEVVLAGPERCIATGLPIPIPDADGFVFAQVDCSLASSAAPSDDDGDGFANPLEIYVGTDPAVPCGTSGWPADLAPTFMGAQDLVDIADITAFLAPTRRLDTSPGDANFNVRYDIVPGAGIFPGFINIADLNALLVLAPPMFGGERALYHTCP